MTKQEAIKILSKYRNKLREFENRLEHTLVTGDGLDVEILDIAIECIEKQIPKEAKYHISGNGWNDWIVYTCPVCGKEFKDSLVCPCCYQRVKPLKESDNE